MQRKDMLQASWREGGATRQVQLVQAREKRGHRSEGGCREGRAGLEGQRCERGEQGGVREVEGDENGGELSVGERGTEVEGEGVWCAADVISVQQCLRFREWKVEADRTHGSWSQIKCQSSQQALSNRWHAWLLANITPRDMDMDMLPSFLLLTPSYH